MIKSTCKICRRLAVSVCGKTNCAMKKRPIPPGMHGKKFKRNVSEFALQLAEKQKVKYTYGIREKQFRKYFNSAAKSKGMTATVLARLLETRLDNAVYRMGFAGSRSQAHQMVGHGHFTVNGKRMNVPSYTVKAGDEIALREGSASKKIFQEARELVKKNDVPAWCALDKETARVRVVRLPEGDELELPFRMQLITEFYSR